MNTGLRRRGSAVLLLARDSQCFSFVLANPLLESYKPIGQIAGVALALVPMWLASHLHLQHNHEAAAVFVTHEVFMLGVLLLAGVTAYA